MFNVASWKVLGLKVNMIRKQGFMFLLTWHEHFIADLLSLASRFLNHKFHLGRSLRFIICTRITLHYLHSACPPRWGGLRLRVIRLIAGLWECRGSDDTPYLKDHLPALIECDCRERAVFCVSCIVRFYSNVVAEGGRACPEFPNLCRKYWAFCIFWLRLVNFGQ